MSIIRKQNTNNDDSKKIQLENLFGSQRETSSPSTSSRHHVASPSLIKKDTTKLGTPIQIQSLNSPEPEKPIKPQHATVSKPIATPPEAPLPSRKDILDELNRFKAETLAQQKKEIDQDVALYKKEQLRLVDLEKKDIANKAYNEGYQEGYQKGEQKLSALSKEALTTINALSVERHTLLKKSEQDSLKLGFAIAEKIIQTQLDKDSKVFQNILKEALAKVTDKEVVIIKVNKKDLTYTRSYKEQFEKELSDIKSLDIQEDSSIEIGGCVIETKLGFIDSSISTKLSIIEKALDVVYEEQIDVEPEPDNETLHS